MNLNQNVKQIYKHIIKKENTNYNTIGQSIWNQYLKKNSMGKSLEEHIHVILFSRKQQHTL